MAQKSLIEARDTFSNGHIVQQQATISSLPIHKFFATTVALITSYNEQQGPNVMACEWTMNVCWQPLRIMSVVRKGELTHELISTSREFGVNMCSEQQTGLSHLAGSGTGYTYDKLANSLFADVLYPGTHIKAPMIDGCVLNAECVVEQSIDIGEYTAFIGRALAVQLNPQLRPLVYHQGKYIRLGDWIPKPVEPIA